MKRLTMALVLFLVSMTSKSSIAGMFDEIVKDYEQGQIQSGYDPYFNDSDKIIDQAAKDCKDYFGIKSYFYKDFCTCVARKTALNGKTQQSPNAAPFGECHYKSELGLSFVQCSGTYISDKKKYNIISGLGVDMINESQNDMCDIWW